MRAETKQGNTMDGKEELFELCKEVSTRLGWAVDEDSDLTRKWGRDGIGNLQIEPIGGGIFFGQVPLYTSDYLLEKLPSENSEQIHAVYGVYLLTGSKSKKWGASWECDTGQYEIEHADTPLKALLKLVIALDDAGELK
jgi:hypothetical protein